MSSPRGAAQGGAASSCCGTEVTLSEEARSLERRRGRDTGGLMSADALEPAGSTSIPAVLAHTAERAGDELAVVDGAVRLTYAELREEARSFGEGLVAVGGSTARAEARRGGKEGGSPCRIRWGADQYKK